ncbi:hypothetical protein GCM10014719_55650 [Planomonospora parontospora subsp. antibiotica]|nr:hypothetical protein GCM10014719_55650 [Planomonospora parontospora subsp. antibiotica]GII20191.1 hypothetical protein Ppa05_69170 [Planomonospora parontospora subsp. antibiotica]
MDLGCRVNIFSRKWPIQAFVRSTGFALRCGPPAERTGRQEEVAPGAGADGPRREGAPAAVPGRPRPVVRLLRALMPYLDIYDDGAFTR